MANSTQRYTSSCLAASLCNRDIRMHIEGDCDNPMFSGIEEAGVIINYNDITAIARDANNPHSITSITLRQGSHAWRFFNERNNPFTGTNSVANVNDYRNDFTHTVAGFIPIDGAAPAQDIITPMANGRYVVILQNQWLHSDGNTVDNEYQIFGIDKGLKMSSMTKTRYENNDYWVVELQEANVPRSGTFLIPAGDACEYVTSLLSDADIPE